MRKNTTPLVSICTTFFSAEKHIHRVLDSCLNQTYRNIEVVIVDDASIDGSKEIIKKYTSRDSRIKYFRNARREKLTLSLAKMFELATGDFIMMIGADDWIARDYIENGVRTLLEHPDVAGIVPELINLSEVVHDKFEFFSETFEKFTSPKVYSAKWFVKRIYRPSHLYISALALIRKKDAVSAINYFLENYCRNTSVSIPRKLKKLFWSGFGIDAVMFLEILTRYKNFVFDSSLHYMKVTHGENLQFDVGQESIVRILENYYYYLLTYKYIHELKWEKYYSGMKIFLATEALSSVLIYIVSNPMSVKLGGKLTSNFLKELTLIEIIAVALYSIIRIICRVFNFVRRAFLKKNEHKKEEFRLFTQENFLDSEGHFKVN